MTDPRARMHEAAFFDRVNAGEPIGFRPYIGNPVVFALQHHDATRHAVSVDVALGRSSWKCHDCEAGTPEPSDDVTITITEPLPSSAPPP